jgi:hypothetical protein
MNRRTIGAMPILAAASAIVAGCALPAPQLANADRGEATSLERCEQVTGSRILRRSTEGCEAVNYPLKSFSAEQIQGTGEMDLHDALRMLDPAFQ